MKFKAFLCLAFTAMAACLIVSLAQGKPASSLPQKISPEGKWAKKLKAPWTDTKVVSHRANGEVVELAARKAVYTVWSIKNPDHPGKPFDMPMVAFLDPKTGKAWIGSVGQGEIETNEFINDDRTVSTNYFAHTNLFFESESEILTCSSVIADGSLDCYGSALNKSQAAETLDSVIERFDKNSADSWPCSGATRIPSFQSSFREGFFSSGNLGSQSTQIQHFAVTNGTLRLDFKSLKYQTTGSVWLDLNTLRVLKALEQK